MATRSLRSLVLFLAKLTASALFFLFLLEMSSRTYFALQLNDPAILFYSGLRVPNNQMTDPSPIGSIRPQRNVDNKYLGYWPGPLKMYVQTPNGFSPYTTTINSLGFRTREVAPPEPNELRIVCLGESSTFGYLLKDEETYPYQLEKILSEKLHRPVKVFNLGTSESIAQWQLGILENTLDVIKPHIVTFYGLHNDVSNLRALGPSETLLQRSLSRKLHGPFLTVALVHHWRALSRSAGADPSEVQILALKNTVLRMAEMSLARGSQFYFVRQRIMPYGEQAPSTSYGEYYQWLDSRGTVSQQELTAADNVARTHYPLTFSIFENEPQGLKIIDPTHALDDRKQHFLSHVHPSAAGAARLAQAIADAID